MQDCTNFSCLIYCLTVLSFSYLFNFIYFYWLLLFLIALRSGPATYFILSPPLIHNEDAHKFDLD